jgi:phosphoserine aminotransferase
MLNYKNSGCSIMELSHRWVLFAKVLTDVRSDPNFLKKSSKKQKITSKPYCTLHVHSNDTYSTARKIPKNYKVLFFQGGGTAQFAAVPLNLLGTKSSADYVVTGSWSQKAFQEVLL